MTHPQQPELSRSGYGETTQDAQEIRAGTRDQPETGGDPGPTPRANQSEEARHSGEKSTVLDAVRDDS
jgi:hypothetical protein